MTPPETGAAPDGARLACAGVTVRFGGLIAVDDAALSVAPGAIVGLVGPNGAGKSTLFGVLSGLIRPASGLVWLDGVDVTRARPQVRAKQGLARSFQHPELFAGLTVRDHLVISHRARHARRRIWSDLFTMGGVHPVNADEKEQVDALIDLLGLGRVAHRAAIGLPLGTARLVELGRALANTPTVLLLDEPSSGLDSSETQQFEQVLRRVADERGTSVLLVEHDVDLVMRMCAHIYVIDFGVMIANGPPEVVHASPKVRAAYLGEQVTATTKPSRATAARTTPRKKAERLPRLVPASEQTSEQTSEQAALAVDDLTVRYGDAIGLAGVSLRVPAGKALAVLGPNGAGKSSLARALSGLVRRDSGRVVFDGKDISKSSAHTIRRAGIVHLPEGRGVFRSLTVVDNLRMASSTVPGGRSARHVAVERALSMFPQLADRRRQVAGRLSGGEQQMLSLARALATSPRLIIADELSLGLAPKMVDAVFDGLERAREAGVTVVMIEQYVHRALAFADECMVLLRGRVAWQGPTDAAADEVLRHYLGDALTVGG
jgi:ABC-type branched-subunit amino acid transport system ATPase component